MNDNDTDLTADELQRMLMCAYEQGARVQTGDGFELVCIDGRVWRLQNRRTEEVVLTVNPMAVSTCDALYDLITDATTAPEGGPSYSESDAADSVCL